MTTATLNGSQTGLRVHRLEVENFMRLEALTIDADGKHVVISGANAQGKTSAVDAIFVALKGASARDCPEPIHKGASRGSITLDLGEYIVERNFTGKGHRLVVTARDGSKIAKPQDLLNGFLGAFSLDPLAFLDRRPQDQVDDVLAIAGVLPPFGKVAEILSLQELEQGCMPKPGESADDYLMRLSADETGIFYQRRREANRLCDQKRAALEEDRRQLQAVGGPVTAGEAPPPIDDLLSEIKRLEGHAESRRQAQAAADEAKRDYQEDSAKLAELGRQLVKADAEIEGLRKALAAKEGERIMLANDIETAGEIVKELHDTAKRHANAASVFTDRTPALEAARKQLAAHGKAKEAIAAREFGTKALQRLSAEAAKAQTEHKRLDDVLAKLRDLRAHLLDGIDLGVDGLEVGDGELRLNGISFRQASTAEGLRVACAIAAIQRPKLRLLRVDRAECLDAASKRALLEIADAQGFQVIMTCVKDHAELKVEIVEGAS